MTKKIAVIGAGYLGAHVAAYWTKQGHHVTTTTRSSERLPDLLKISEKSMVLKTNDEVELSHLLHNNDTLLVTIAADSPDDYEEAYLQTALTIRRIAIRDSLIRFLIYTSSTSVYGDHQGKWVEEKTPLLAQSDQGKILIETERVYESLTQLGWHVCILRLAGLYGPGRDLTKHLLSLKNGTLPGNGNNYTNMVHQEDATRAIDYALRHHLKGVYNLADDNHPLRKDLYKQLAKEAGAPLPKWDPHYEGWHGSNKRVSNHKLKSEGFEFHHACRLSS